MKYIKCELSDNTIVKFKIRRLSSYGLDIAWKYVGKINLARYINLDVSQSWTYSTIQILQQLTDEELIDKYIHKIEEQHLKIKNTKRIIN